MPGLQSSTAGFPGRRSLPASLGCLSQEWEQLQGFPEGISPRIGLGSQFLPLGGPRRESSGLMGHGSTWKGFLEKACLLLGFKGQRRPGHIE